MNELTLPGTSLGDGNTAWISCAGSAKRSSIGRIVPSATDSLRHVPRQDRHAHALAGGRQHGRQVVRPQGPAHRHHLLGTVGAGEHPAVVALHGAVDQRGVLRQVRTAASACRALLQVGRAADHHPRVEAEVARAELESARRPMRMARSMPCSTRFDVAVLEAQVDRCSWDAAHVAQHQRHQHAPAERHRRADAQRAADAAPASGWPGCRPRRSRWRWPCTVVVQRAHLGGA
jgi:hypothetical protein